MHLVYFDESKHSEKNPIFTIGGILVPQKKAKLLEETLTEIQRNFFGSSELVKANEFHGTDLLQGKNQFKGRDLQERINVFKDIASCILINEIPIRLVCINVDRLREKYKTPYAPYSLGLMFFLEQASKYLDGKEDLGVIHGDHDPNEVKRAVTEFSEYKSAGSTPMQFGRSLDSLVDTIHFPPSHHSRFIQVADVVVYMASRYQKPAKLPENWHHKQVYKIWKKLAGNADLHVKSFPSRWSMLR